MKLNQLLANNVKLFDSDGILRGESLKTLVPELLKTDEFKDVKKLNIVDYPHWVGNQETEEFQPDGVGILIHSYKFGYTSFFSSIVNLYSITLSPKVYDPNELNKLGKGVWVMPLIAEEPDLEPIRQIRINYSPKLVQDLKNAKIADGEAKMKELIFEQLEKALKGPPNIPSKRAIIFRCSPKSMKLNVEKDCYVYDVSIPNENESVVLNEKN